VGVLGGDRRIGGARRILAGLAASILLFSSCAQGEEEDADTPTFVEGISPPLTAVLEDGLTLFAALDTAVDRWIVGCMLQEGFEYEAIAREKKPELRSPRLTVERARSYGYRTDAQFATDLDAVSSTHREYLEGLSEASLIEYAVALHGPTDGERITIETDSARISMSTDGCLAVARATVGGDSEAVLSWYASYSQIEDLGFEVDSLIDVDERWRATLAGWTECMQTLGYNVNSTQGARELAISGPPVGGPPPTATAPTRSSDGAVIVESDVPVSAWELDVAIADASCREDVDYYSTWDRLRFEYESTELAKNQGALFAWQEADTEIRRILPDLILRGFEDG